MNTKINIQPFEVVHTMQKYGGSFVKALASAFMAADGSNFRKLREAFPEYWDQYTEMAKLTLVKAESSAQ